MKDSLSPCGLCCLKLQNPAVNLYHVDVKKGCRDRCKCKKAALNAQDFVIVKENVTDNRLNTGTILNNFMLHQFKLKYSYVNWND